MSETFNVRPEVSEIASWVIEIRRKIHANPEIQYQEYETSALIEGVFKELGLEMSSGFGGTGIAAVWDSGRPGPVVALRADMDALNLHENTGLAFCSTKPGLMHACGHDGHVAMVLGVAKLLVQHGSEWPINGRVMFVCQPAEEGGAGAKAMLDDGLYEWLTPDLIFCIHLNPDEPVGTISISRELTAMAGSLDFFITVTGQGGHGAMPQLTNNPIAGVSAIIQSLLAIKLPGAVISPTIVNGGFRTNTIPEEAKVEGTLRFLTPEDRKAAQESVEEALKKGEFDGLAAVIKWEPGYAPTINNPKAAELVKSAGRKFLGDDQVKLSAPSFGSEDMSFFLNKTPGAFFWMGVARKDGTASGPLHSSTFNPSEKAFPVGVELWLRLLEAIAADYHLDSRV